MAQKVEYLRLNDFNCVKKTNWDYYTEMRGVKGGGMMKIVTGLPWSKNWCWIIYYTTIQEKTLEHFLAKKNIQILLYI